MGLEGPPPGWYADPGGSSGLRWWDGGTWTQHLASPMPAQGTFRGPDPRLVQSAESRRLPWTKAAIWVTAAVPLIIGISGVVALG